MLDDHSGKIDPFGIHQFVPPVMKVGYSMPSAAEFHFGVNQGQRLVGVGAVPALKVVETLLEDAGVALFLIDVARLHHDIQLHGTHAAGQTCLSYTL